MTLDELADRYWLTYAEYNPTVATTRGEHEFDDQLRRFDEDWLGDMAAAFRSLTEDALVLDAESMATQERITVDLLIHETRVWAQEIGSRLMVAPIDPYLGPHTRLLSDTRQNTVTTVEQADAILGRYGKVPVFLEGALRLHLANASVGMTPALASVERVIGQLDGYLESELADDPFLQLEVPGGSERWKERAEAIVVDQIRPAFEKYRDGLVSEVTSLARSDERCGLTWIDGGEEIYSSLIHKYTQLDARPEEIHDIGIHWATQVNAAEWVDIGGEALGAETMEEVFRRLHDDPGMRFGSEEEMLEQARDAVDRAWNAVDDWFGASPETPCRVVPVPRSQAPAMPPAYYMQPPIDGSRPGTYFLNTYKPEERDRFEYESIHFHEAVPGHHFDRSLAAELTGIPTFRRYAQVYAHTEGWGLYAERLADEMGLYSSDLDRLGMVSADAWRAGRLVTDTGIHALGWSRQQAIDFLSEWTPIGQLTIAQEVDRYIGMPAQALSYKMGQLEIMRLRREAEAALGDRFDIRGFHDSLLTHGAMPLPTLTDTVEEWVSSYQ